MLKIEVDIFSGRPNPVWFVTDSVETEKLIASLSENKKALSKSNVGFSGLGFREIRIQVLADEGLTKPRLPSEFSVGSTAAEDFKGSGEIARRIVNSMPLDSKIILLEHGLTPLTGGLRDFVLENLERHISDRPMTKAPRPKPAVKSLRKTINDERSAACQYEISVFNPAFWNRPAVQPHNNCYNYGRNWRTDTFAQPGRAHGQQYASITCAAVTTAAMADGLVKRGNCLPQSEYPRRLMALVVGPGWDYHWYRHQQGGFWGHKPGGTAARNYDNSGNVITNPETCNRGGYTDFCGYFYAGRSVVIN